ncbi:MAG TPA: sensor histidine kinase [Methanobacteriaceae archaeon]|nr:sensor histidine kinase [Methanobacteriaceae archaeon]
MEKILISMVNHQNVTKLGELLGSNREILKLDDENLDDEFDLLITDLPSWVKRKKTLQERKKKEHPLLLPYLLVVTPQELKFSAQEVWENFDEVITIPISKVVLEARLKILIQNRQLSLQVNQLLEDKDMLIKEIHHRVKNNLTIMSSLLSLQSRYIKDEEAKEIFKESQDRARTMALIHERLYRSGDLKRIDFGDYIRTLSKDLYHTYVGSEQEIDLKLDLEDHMLDINTTIPLGLILNELVTNCMKYAFPEGKRGQISINFHQLNENYVLEVIDDGVGFPSDLDLEQSDSLGMKLINSLSSQIDAKVELERSPGTTFRIKFREKEFT